MYSGRESHYLNVQVKHHNQILRLQLQVDLHGFMIIESMWGENRFLQGDILKCQFLVCLADSESATLSQLPLW